MGNGKSRQLFVMPPIKQYHKHAKQQQYGILFILASGELPVLSQHYVWE